MKHSSTHVRVGQYGGFARRYKVITVRVLYHGCAFVARVAIVGSLALLHYLKSRFFHRFQVLNMLEYLNNWFPAFTTALTILLFFVNTNAYI